MSFNWFEYLNLAKELAGQHRRPASNEAKQRAAISRAYYAVYHSAKEYLINKGLWSSPNFDSHQQVRDTFQNSHKLDWVDIGNIIDNLFWERVRADYKDDYKKIDKNMNVVLSDSEATIHKINLLR